MSDWSQITQRVNAGAISKGQALKSYVGKVALSTTAITTIPLETVTAGKIFYITDMFISHDTANVIDVRIQAAGADIFRAPIKGDTAPVQMTGIETGPSATAGQQVNLVYPIVGVATNVYFSISGYEQ